MRQNKVLSFLGAGTLAASSLCLPVYPPSQAAAAQGSAQLNPQLLRCAGQAALRGKAGTASGDTWLQSVEGDIRKGTVSAATIEQLSAAVQSSPANPRLHRMLAEVLQLHGYEQLAYEQFLLANQSDPGYLLSIFHKRMEQPLLGNPRTLLAACRNIYPNDSGVVYFEALTELKAHDQKRALLLFRRAANMSHPWPHALSVVCELEANMGMWQDADSHALEQLKNDPQDVQALSVHLRCQHHCGRSLKSMHDELESAYRSNASDPFICLMYARSAIDRGDFTAALDPALRALLMPYGPPPESTAEAVENVYQHVSFKDFANAVTNALCQINNPVYRPYFRMKVAQVYEANGRHEDAHRQLQIAMVSGEAALSPSLAMQLALLSEHKYQDLRLALGFYRQVRQSQPNNALAMQAEARILDRAANYHNDLAWQLKSVIWGTSKLMPQPRRRRTALNTQKK